ncbi:hypothetical protein KBY96_03350 [Cyanobium sp. ATX 6A2]|uniref:hypothetical protein n=1 Tax=Cyanobium sp. ATX 6A2 TaxID=2823700 RepID=UPI0020CE993F|nr:hypothetical protein [Cyanobium sp. ATX 6A2]MCP9886971.1 hypothetical protein [Cyanobium sp. ATX 6A2]
MSLTPEILQQRYATIERLYSEREWPQVEALSKALLGELPADPADPVRLRLQLLLGHTRLYGLGAVGDARDHYQAVLDNCNETTLREIAEQGLQQCTQVEEGKSLPTPAEPAASLGEIAATAAATATGTAAMPWMEELTVEVVEEPEQLEVAQADPGSAEDLELESAPALAGGGRPARRPADPLAFDPTRLSARELEELSRGLLRVRLA